MISLAISRAMTLIILVLSVGLVASRTYQLSSKYAQHQPSAPEEVFMPNKRPYCKSFTGCGQKRSAPVPLDMMKRSSGLEMDAKDSGEEDNLGSLLDLSSEPAVEELSRQIMSEAKLWEAIQEASAELTRRRQDTPYPPAFSTQ